MKAQSGVEYLATYAFSIMLIIVIVAVLVALSFFKPQTPVSCTFPANFYCVGSKLLTTGYITLDIAQKTNHQIIVMGFRCTQETSVSILNNTINVTIANNDHAIIANGTNFQCLDSKGVAVTGTLGSTYKGKLYIYYIEDDTRVDHIVSGEISVKYE